MTTLMPLRMVAIEAVNYRKPDRWNELIDVYPELPAVYRSLGANAVGHWGGTGYHYDPDKPETKFNRTMLPTNPDDWDQGCNQVFEMFANARKLGMKTLYHEGDIGQVVYGKWPRVRREWSHRAHHEQQMKRIATIRKFGADFVSLDHCGNRAGMLDQKEGHIYKPTPDLDDAAYKEKYPREPGSLKEGLDMFRGGLPGSQIVIEPSSYPDDCWWKSRVAATDLTMQQVDLDMNRIHDPDKGVRSHDDFVILAEPPDTLDQMRKWMGEANAQGSHAIVKCWDVHRIVKRMGRAVPGGG